MTSESDQAEIHRLCNSQSHEDRLRAARSIEQCFSNLPDKYMAWQDITILAQDNSNSVREHIARALGINLNLIDDKNRAWEILHNFTLKDHDIDVIIEATKAIGLNLSQSPNGDQAWQDLCRLAQDDISCIRGEAIIHLEKAFTFVPDKVQAWDDLIKLTKFNRYQHSSRRKILPQGHEYTYDEYGSIRKYAARILAMIFDLVPDRAKILQDLCDLSQAYDSDVQMYAYYTLGKAYIIESAEAQDVDGLKSNLETAITYFENSSKIFSDINPAKFCLSFYRSYLAITFNEAKEDEVQRYLAEAKEAVGSSKSKGVLLMAVENLAEALRRSQILKTKSVEEIASDLNTYRWYCDKAAEYMSAVEDEAPGAVMLMRKCNPLLEERIQATIAEIQKKARLISPEIERKARCLLLDDPIKAHQCCIRMASALRDSLSRLPKEKSELICSILKDIEKGGDLSLLLEKLELAMAYTLPAIEAERKEILDQLRNIQFSISNLNISSGSARKDLYELKTSVRSVQDKMAAQALNMEDLGKILKERDHAMIEILENMRNDWLKSAEKMAQDLPSCDDKVEFLMEIRSLKQSQRRDVLGITGDISSIAGLFIGLIGLAAL